MLIVDDLLALPGKIGGIILSSIAQTAHRMAWIEYQRQLNNILIKAKHDREMGKLNEEKYRKIEGYVFKEMRIARRVLTETK